MHCLKTPLTPKKLLHVRQAHTQLTKNLDTSHKLYKLGTKVILISQKKGTPPAPNTREYEKMVHSQTHYCGPFPASAAADLSMASTAVCKGLEVVRNSVRAYSWVPSCFFPMELAGWSKGLESMGKYGMEVV